MGGMFIGNIMFNQDLSDWDVSSVTIMNDIFKGCTSMNQKLCWDVSKVDTVCDIKLGTGTVSLLTYPYCLVDKRYPIGSQIVGNLMVISISFWFSFVFYFMINKLIKGKGSPYKYRGIGDGLVLENSNKEV